MQLVVLTYYVAQTSLGKIRNLKVGGQPHQKTMWGA